MEQCFVLLVRVQTKEPVTKTDIKQYVRDAVESFGGGFPADHPLFNLKKVTVKTA